jgi:hypothetical protein
MGRNLRCILAALLAALLAAAVMVAASGCGGGGSSNPEDAISAAAKHRDQLEGELLLAEVEVDQAFLREDEEEAVDEPRKAARAISRILTEVHKVEHECHEGNGLESCTAIEPIEELVKEIEGEARVGPDR